MMHRSLAALALTLISSVALPAVAKADSFTTFNLNGTLVNGSVAGTITIDTTTGAITGENFAATVVLPIVGSQIFTFKTAPTVQGDDPLANNDYTALFTGSSLATFQLGFPLTSLKNYTGGNICSTSVKCGLSTSALGLDLVTKGSLVAPTPEPSSLLLLGTGVLGLAGVVRRRLSSAA